jgi:hypothetical protein
MAFGLPTKEEIRDGLIARGLDPATAEREAAVAVRVNNRDAALSSLIYGTSGGRALMEAGPAIMGAGRSAISNIGARGKDALSAAKEFMTKPSVAGEGFKINPQTGNVLQNVAPKGGVRPRPDLPFGVKLPAEPTFSTAQQLARYGLPSMGAVGATSYLANSGDRKDAEVGARQAEELRARVPEMLTPVEGGDERMMQPAPIPPRVADLVARAQSSAPRRAPAAAPAAPAAAPAADEGILSKIFGGDPYKGMDSAALMKRANENPDDAASFFRADKALREERPEMFAAGGTATGGGEKMHKDAALHKALEIIHALIGRR